MTARRCRSRTRGSAAERRAAGADARIAPPWPSCSTRDEEIDLVIPRGGEQLIRFVAEHSRIPVIKHYRGNCHVFVERSADAGMALEICYNSKVQRPGVCNAAETILVDEAIAHSFLPQLAERLGRAGVELRGDERARAVVPALKPATDEDFAAEFLDLICAVGVVSGLGGAVRHIERYGSSHTETIVTRDAEAAERFTDEIEARASWSTPRRASPTAASSASAPRSEFRRHACMPTGRWGPRS